MQAAVNLMLGALAVGALAAGAQAGPATYNFNYTQTAVNTFNGGTGTGNISGQFSVENGSITGISGNTSLFGPITGLLPPGSYPIGAEPNDNAFNAASPWLDGGGVSFTAGSNLFNLSWDSFNVIWDGFTNGTSGSGTLVVSLPGPLGGPEPVAEPAGLALLMGGLLGLAATRRRRG